jgi:hypothetical protein
MAQGQYSKLYHVLMDEYPKVWGSDVLLGAFVRLLVVADKWWPQVAQKPPGVSRYAFKLLIECGLVAKSSHPGGYSIRGLDKERRGRSEHGRYAATTRWSNPLSNAPSNAQLMPSKAKQSKAEQIDAPSTNGTGSGIQLGYRPKTLPAGQADGLWHRGQHSDCSTCRDFVAVNR